MSIKNVLIHCKPSLLNWLKENNMNYNESPYYGDKEYDVIVEDIPYEIFDGTYQEPIEELCSFYGINRDLLENIGFA